MSDTGGPNPPPLSTPRSRKVMPITLGCPSCGKRFRARDESAGKKVKCPYCHAAVRVPTAEESATAGAPTAPLPPGSSMSPAVPPPRPAPPARPTSPSRPLPPPAPVVATPDDWGALPTGPKPPPPSAVPPPPPPAPPPDEPSPVAFPPAYAGAGGGRGTKERPKPARAKDKPKGGAPEETPEQILADGWRKVRRGLFRVQLGLFLLALIGFVGFGKMVAARSGYELPTGEGRVQIEGYVNSGVNSVTLTQTDEQNLLLYGLPVVLGGLLLVFGRVTAGGAPQSSGARGMFALSGLFLLVGLAGLILAVAFDRLLMRDEYRYAWTAFLLLAPLAEYWFLTALTASGVALKRPKAARAVGMIGFVAALLVFGATLGWDLYKQYGRPKPPDADVLLYEQAAMMLGWLFLIGVYWRAVGGVRWAAREFLDTVDGGA